jgi:uncharacterized protein YecE (DUF72 family)
LAADASLLTTFVRLLPRQDKAAFEFRNATWFSDEIYKILTDHNIALCLAESEKLETPPVVTSDFVYFRLRKASYSESELHKYLPNGRPTYAIFKHEDTPDGALNAEKLLAASRARQNA